MPKVIKRLPEIKPMATHANYSHYPERFVPDWDNTGGMDAVMRRIKARNGTIRRVPKGGKGASTRSARNVTQINNRG